ncbi:hypothetical protein PLESTF_000830800 [Pleodorina starrii]|nr:hypothetical protein PLESTM_000897500 [Pleodorina starrii]GLC69439.1 hypothetical protein PLESTF_000830800 [Pleodorina starrii]
MAAGAGPAAAPTVAASSATAGPMPVARLLDGSVLADDGCDAQVMLSALFRAAAQDAEARAAARGDGGSGGGAAAPAAPTVAAPTAAVAAALAAAAGAAAGAASGSQARPQQPRVHQRYRLTITTPWQTAQLRLHGKRVVLTR